MKHRELLEDLAAQGVELWAEGDNLRYRGPKEVLTPTVLSRIRDYKDRLLGELSPRPTRERNLVAIQSRGSRPPLFCIHPSGSDILCYTELGRELGKVQPVYGLRATGLRGVERPLATVPEMADRYIEEMRTVQPKGPYRLLGWSMGGAVALEVAQRLRRHGQAVDPLVLVDPLYRSFSGGHIDEGMEVHLLRSFFLHLAGRHGHLQAETLGKQVEDVAREGRLAHLFEQARLSGLISPEMDLQHVRRLWDVFLFNIRAWLQYTVAPYSGAVKLLYAAATGNRLSAPPSGWEGFKAADLEIVELPGDHFTLLRQPAVRRLAEHVKQWLADAPEEASLRASTKHAGAPRDNGPAEKLAEYLKDPFLRSLHDDIRRAGPLKTIAIDITHKCNLRCKGCHFFHEGMDRYKAPLSEGEFRDFIAKEKARGTNLITVMGGEPGLMIGRLKELRRHFRISVITNGTMRIPMDGLEDITIAISVWGDHGTDTELRGRGTLDVFDEGLRNYRDDPRAMWYYTVTSGNAREIPRVVEQCVENGNFITFNYYGDLQQLGGAMDHRRGFDDVRSAIECAIRRFPGWVLFSSHVNGVVSAGKLYDEKWGYEVCANLSADRIPEARRRNGKPYNPHFRVYTPDLKTTRKCCVGDSRRDCLTCYDTWSHQAWIMLNMEKHLGSKREFTNWLTATYLFYLTNRVVDFETGVSRLRQIHERTCPRVGSSIHVKGAQTGGAS